MKYASIENVFEFMKKNCKKLLNIALPIDDFGNTTYLVSFTVNYISGSYIQERKCSALFEDFTCTVYTECLKPYQAVFQEKWHKFLSKKYPTYAHELKKLERAKKQALQHYLSHGNKKPKFYIVQDENTKGL